jgi:hypothetical protein
MQEVEMPEEGAFKHDSLFAQRDIQNLIFLV